MTDLGTDILATLCTIAPEIDPAQVDRRVPLRDQLDLDSMDYLRFLAALSTRYALDIPEADAADLATVDQLAEYVQTRTS